MDAVEVEQRRRGQHGVLARRQILAAGGSDNDIERMLRRRELAVVHPGVYVDHTGPLTPRQREWAAVLWGTPAALGGLSATRRHGMHHGRARDPDADVVHLVVRRERHLQPPPGVALTRVSTYDADVLANLGPPRQRLEPAVLLAAGQATSELEAVALLADAVQSRLTTAARLLICLEGRPRQPRRALLRRVLADVADGAQSALEWLYLTRVERPHGLPTGRRQRRVHSGPSTAYRDVEYLGAGVIVELDGRFGHERALDRSDDLDRDLDATIGGTTTLRLGWGQVLQPCRTAGIVARVLDARGWRGAPTPCGPSCCISGA